MTLLIEIPFMRDIKNDLLVRYTLVDTIEERKLGLVLEEGVGVDGLHMTVQLSGFCQKRKRRKIAALVSGLGLGGAKVEEIQWEIRLGTSWELHYSFPTWNSSPYTIHVDICDGSSCVSWEEIYTAGSPPGGGGGGGIGPVLDSLVVNPVIPSHNYVTQGEYHNFKAYAHSTSGGSLTYQWYVNGTPKTTAWELHYSFPTWDSSPYNIRLEIFDGPDSTSWEETYTPGTPPGGGNVADKLYYIRDHLGSIRVVIDDNGDVVHYADYYPFGMEMAGRTGTTERPKEGFTGHEKDEETGEYYAGARYYDAEIGRWNGIDPLAKKYASWSPYHYSANNPPNISDLDGREWYRNDSTGTISWINGSDPISGFTHLGEDLTFTFVSYIDGRSWDGPAPAWFVRGDKMTSIIRIDAQVGEEGAISAVSITFERSVGRTAGIFPGQVSVPGLPNIENQDNDPSSFWAQYEAHTMVHPLEAVGLQALGYDYVNVAQYLYIQNNGGTLDINASTDVFPSAKLSLRGSSGMAYDLFT